jgi:phenylpropionate dioxygenase-like ring-hydroxylating dioxygenase large terminal subunit
MPNRIERTSALPLDLFSDEAVFEMELGEMWHRDWIFATTGDAIAEPGQYVPVTIGRQSVIVVRGDDYTIRALANACSHRGSPLVDAPGRASKFSCPYHAWSYGTDGELISVPYAMPDEVVHAEHGLAGFRVEQWHGLVFVSLDPDVEPFADRVSAIEPYIKPLAVERLHHDVGGIAVERWNANWKVIYANAVDSYSHFRVHAETIEPVSPTDASYYLAGSARATVTGGESMERADHLVISVPPSFVAIVYPDALLWQAFTPLTVGTTRITTGIAGERPADDASAVHLPGWDAAFVDEDRAICERLQTNATSRWKPGPLIELERAIGDFHDYLAWRLADQPPGPPTIAALPGDRPEPPL